jgi:hypothetical protein
VVDQVGSFGGVMDEVEALKRDKTVLMLELVRLRQQQQVQPVSSPLCLCLTIPSLLCQGSVHPVLCISDTYMPPHEEHMHL